ncbi:MAG: transposase, mutator type [Actinoallomurus sp.]|nr:transposase, mutator type [Actinoallomurus sp.]
MSVGLAADRVALAQRPGEAPVDLPASPDRPAPDRYLVIRSPHKNRANVTGQTPGWKTALNALSLYYGDRITLN